MKAFAALLGSVLVSAVVHYEVLRVPLHVSVEAIPPQDSSLTVQLMGWEPQPQEVPEEEPPAELDPEPEPKPEKVEPAPSPPPVAPQIPPPEPEPEPPPPEPVVEEVQATVTTESQAALSSSYWSEVCNEIAGHLRYPVSARRAGRSCRVMIRLEIDSRGGLVTAEVLDVLGSMDLVRGALAALRQSAPFPPPPAELHPPVVATLPIQYELSR